jgi:hypothetical protein
MTISPQNRRILALVGVLGVVAAVAYWPSSSAVAPEPGIGVRNASRGASTAVAADPSVVPRLMLDQGRGEITEKVGRNVFRCFVPPTPVPTRPPPPPTPLPAVGTLGFIGPMPLPPPPTPTPIVPPVIPFKAIGIFGPRERPIVSFEDGSRLINAREGDTLDGRFIVKTVNRESVDFAFVGLPPDITRRIPVLSPGSPR